MVCYNVLYFVVKTAPPPCITLHLLYLCYCGLSSWKDFMQNITLLLYLKKQYQVKYFEYKFKNFWTFIVENLDSVSCVFTSGTSVKHNTKGKENIRIKP